MKRLLLIAVLLITAAPVFAEGLYVTPAFNLEYGIGDWHDNPLFTLNPGLGFNAILGFGISESLAIEGTIGLSYFITDSDYYDDITYYEIPVYIGVNYHLTEIFGLIGGVGLSYGYFEIQGLDNSDTNFAFYLGGEINVSNIIVRPYFQFINTSGDSANSLNLSIGYKFGG